MKRIWLITAALALFAMTVGGATLAFFSDATGSTNNTFVAGTVALDSERMYDTVPGPMFYIGEEGGELATGLWAPGDFVERDMEVRNTGSLDAKITKIMAAVTNDPDNLASQLSVTVTEWGDVIAQGDLSDFLGDGLELAVPIELEANAMGATALTFTVTFKLDATDDYQDKTAVVSFSVHAEQVKNNP